jgi:polyhydroxyalkanoate synthase
MTTDLKQRAQRNGEAIGSGLDVMLADAVAGTPRFFAPGPAINVAASLAHRPRGLARRAAGLTTELARAATGRSQLTPAGGNRRFTDPAWQQNWLLRDVLQAYLAVGNTVDGLIDDAAVDWRTERQARLVAGNVMDALAPTNFPWSNPAVLREIVNTGGASLAKGLRRLARDLSTPPRLPATVDTSRFELASTALALRAASSLRVPPRYVDGSRIPISK